MSIVRVRQCGSTISRVNIDTDGRVERVAQGDSKGKLPGILIQRLVGTDGHQGGIIIGDSPGRPGCGIKIQSQNLVVICNVGGIILDLYGIGVFGVVNSFFSDIHRVADIQYFQSRETVSEVSGCTFHVDILSTISCGKGAEESNIIRITDIED